MKLFRVVGIVKYINGIEKLVYEEWGKAILSIESMNQLAHLNNIKYKNWFLEYKEE